MINQRLQQLFDGPTVDDILFYLETNQAEEVEALYSFADETREKYVGGSVHLRAIIEFSNYCRRGCCYCGINRTNKNIKRYRIPPKEIVGIARDAYFKGYKTVVLQSGEDPHYTLSDYLFIISEIKKTGNLAITLAFGEKNEEEYRAYFEAGADRFLLKHETSDPGLYKELNPGMSLENRINCLKTLKAIGFETGGGIMIGLPGQTLESIAKDLLLFKELDLDMIGCGPFIPHPETPLRDYPPGTAEMTYRVLALNRVIMRDINLPATTALSTVDETEGRRLALQRGANVVMPNFTPPKYRRYYDIYPNKKRIEVSNMDYRNELETMLSGMGRYVSRSAGYHQNNK